MKPATVSAALQRTRNRAGFTLVEILLVVLIIAILLLVAAPLFTGQSTKAYNSEAQQTASVAYRSAAADNAGNDRSFGASQAAFVARLAAAQPSFTFRSYVSGDSATWSTGPKVVSVALDTTNPTDVATMCVKSKSGWFYCRRFDSKAQLQKLLAGDSAGQAYAMGGTQTDSMAALPTRSVAPTSNAGTGGTGQPGWSERGSVPAPVVPLNVAIPSITGTPASGTPLSVNSGTWSGPPVITYTYQWQQCTAAGISCVNIPGATNSTYTPVAGDIGKTIAVVVTATNSNGSTGTSSVVTGLVTGSAYGTYVAERAADSPSTVCRFNESGASYVNFSCAGGINGQLQANSSDFLTGQAGSLSPSGDNDTGVYFTGTTQYSYANTGGQTTNNGAAWSAEAWVRPDNAAPNQMIIGGENNWGLKIAGGSGFACDMRQNSPWAVVSISGGSPATALTWYHVVCTYSSNTLRLYVNGTQVASQAGVNPGQSGNGNLNPGYANSGWTSGGYLRGRLDEFAFYQTALSAARVNVHYHAAGY